MKKLIAANWKMYKTRDDAQTTASELLSNLSGQMPEDRELLVCPPFTSLDVVTKAFEGADGFFVGGQNFHHEEQGAYTGELSPGMLKDAGCTYALVGHSERRWTFMETDETIAKKVLFGLESGLRIILCIGEKIEERKAKKVEDVLTSQLEIALQGVAKDLPTEQIAIAYEPVWAIGTGEVAGPEEIINAHAFIRKKMVALFPDFGHSVQLLYGGSVKPANAKEILSLDNVDGVLVGGASLQAESFSKIAMA